MGDGRNTYSDLVGKPEGKEPLGRPRRRWEDNIKRVLLEVGWDHGLVCVISDFRREVAEKCALLYAASIGKFLSTFRDNFGRILWNFGFNIMLEISLLVEKRSACQDSAPWCLLHFIPHARMSIKQQPPLVGAVRKPRYNENSKKFVRHKLHQNIQKVIVVK